MSLRAKRIEIIAKEEKYSEEKFFEENRKGFENMGVHYFNKYNHLIPHLTREDWINEARLIAWMTINNKNLITDGLYKNQILQRINFQLMDKLGNFAMDNAPCQISRTKYRHLCELRKRINERYDNLSEIDKIKEELRAMGMTNYSTKALEYQELTKQMIAPVSLQKPVSKDGEKVITLEDLIADEEEKKPRILETLENAIMEEACKYMSREDVERCLNKDYKGLSDVEYRRLKYNFKKMFDILKEKFNPEGISLFEYTETNDEIGMYCGYYTKGNVANENRKKIYSRLH